MSKWRTFWKRDKPLRDTKSAMLHFTTATVPNAYFGRNSQRHATNDSVQRLLTTSEIVYACLKIKADSARDPQLIVQRKITKGTKTEYQEVADHPFTQLMARPNPLMTEADFMAAAVASWDMTTPRRFYAAKVYVSGVLTELWPLNPIHMQPRYNSSHERIGWTWADGLRTVDYTNDDILVREAPSWYDPAPGVVALSSATSDAEHTRYIENFFLNGGIPPVFLKDTQRFLSTPQRDEIRQKWLAIYGNASGGQHGIGILDAGQEISKVGSIIKDLDNESLRSFAESRICMLFGVPPLIIYAYVGLLRATYSNLSEAWQSFWDATMSPALRDWRLFLTFGLLTEYESEQDIRTKKVRLHYDMSNVAAYQDDVDAVAERVRGDYQAGLITRNEARTQRGYEADTRPEVEGDDYKTSGDIRGGNGEQVFGYHITEGIVDINEARERLGFEPRDDGGRSLRLRTLQSQFSAIDSIIKTGVPLEAALEVAEIDEKARAIIERWLSQKPQPEPQEDDDDGR
jgi:HK97 family phage portal protein